MKNVMAALLSLVVLSFAQIAGATFIDLNDSASVHDAASETNLLATLGTLTLHYNTPGDHHGGVFLDYEINEPTNTFFNEYGGVHGNPAPGLTWEINEPYYSGIYENLQSLTLAGNIFNGAMTGPEDVSVALLWNFTLGLDETADILFTASLDKPGDDSFYLIQSDGPNGEDPLYLSTRLTVSPAGGEPVPEPGTSLLVGLGLLGLGFFARRKRLS